MDCQMTPIEQWLADNKEKITSGYNIEPELITTWPFFIVDTIRPKWKQGPGRLPNSVVSTLGSKLQKAVYKIRKASTMPDLYALVKPSNADHYMFIVATSTPTELDILAKGFANNTEFKIFFQ